MGFGVWGQGSPRRATMLARLQSSRSSKLRLSDQGLDFFWRVKSLSTRKQTMHLATAKSKTKPRPHLPLSATNKYVNISPECMPEVLAATRHNHLEGSLHLTLLRVVFPLAVHPHLAHSSVGPRLRDAKAPKLCYASSIFRITIPPGCWVQGA